MAEDSFARGGSPLYADLARRHADDPLVAEIAGDHKPRWEIPLRLFGAVHFLALSGEEDDPWTRFRDVLRERREWLADFMATQPVQTNEVQRSWALLPAFLAAADDRPVDLVELGPSAGLNLVWDRYRFEYEDGAWGPTDARVVLRGETRHGPPPELLARRVEVRRRVGIDQAPIDVRDERQALLLQCFVWADQPERLERLRRAIDVARESPPGLVRADYVELLPRVLAERDPDVLTVVFNSATTSYLRREERERLAAEIDAAGSAGSLAWVSYEFADDEDERRPSYEAFTLELSTWPPGRRRTLALTDGHANHLRWIP